MSRWRQPLLPVSDLGEEIGAYCTDRRRYHQSYDMMSVVIGRGFGTEGPLVLIVFFSRAAGHLFTLCNGIAQIIFLQTGVGVNFALEAGTGAWGFVQDRTELEIFG